MKPFKTLPAIVLTLLLLALPFSGCKNEQKNTAENKPLTRQDLEEVLGKRKLTQEEENAREARETEDAKIIEEQTKGYGPGGVLMKNEENQAKTP